MENKEIMVATNEAQSIVTGITNAGNELFYSFDVQGKEDQVKLYNATAGDGESLKASMNKVLNVVDVVVMPVDLKDDEGKVTTVPRVTLITADGMFYSSSSWGVYNSLKKIAAIFGGLHFDEPLKISPIEVKTKNGFTINLKLI